MNIKIPELSLVALVGATSSGKTTFARKHFRDTEILSSDRFRALVSDDESEQTATRDAFDALHFVLEKRLKHGKLSVIDATNLQKDARPPLVRAARMYHAMPVAIVLKTPVDTLLERHRQRTDRDFSERVVKAHARQLAQSIKRLKRDGFKRVYVLETLEDVDSATIERTKAKADLRHEFGPFDLIGDVHGCFDELVELLRKLGWSVETEGRITARNADGRRVVFVGDLVDRGPKNAATLELVLNMVEDGVAMCVRGNHDDKLGRWLEGRKLNVSNGLKKTIEELERAPDGFRARLKNFVDGLLPHVVLDEGRLVVAHAGLEESMHGRMGGTVRSFALYGKTTGEKDEFGYPVRLDWAADYRGDAAVVYGHTVVPRAVWRNNTICIDQGCVFGGELTAVRWPERDVVSVPAAGVYYGDGASKQAANLPKRDGQLAMSDVEGKRFVQTRFGKTVRITEEHAAAALEVMSRFAVAPEWLPYLPPTISPCRTAPEGVSLLERPDEVYADYAKWGVERLIAEEKHMGSRALLMLARDADAARDRFGEQGRRTGRLVTRTGRPFFKDAQLETTLVTRISHAIDSAGLWDRLDTSWMILDAELMPWSAKAGALIRDQYDHVARAGDAFYDALNGVLRDASIPALQDATESVETRRALQRRYAKAFEPYAWPFNTVDDIRIAPFHLLAAEGFVGDAKDHEWHMKTLATLADHDVILQATRYRIVELDDAGSRNEATAWWNELVAAGSEGAVFKPLDWHAGGSRRVQPAMKCRGAEYLRIIYGPTYDLPEQLERLRKRGLGRKRRLAMDEYLLGLEALHRFVEREPLHRVHEPVFSILALESEPVDPRL